MKSSHSPVQPRWWDLPSIFLVVIILTIAFTRLVVTQWAENLDVTRTICYLGLAAGLALGISRFSPRRVAFFALVYGLFVIPWQIGLTLGEGIAWQERLQSMLGRLQVIFSYLMQQRPVPDNLLFLYLMGLVFWTLGVHAGYSLTRYAQPWSVILPAGLTLVVMHTYDPLVPRRIWYLIFYLFFALLLVARLVFIHHRRRWEQSQTYVPPYLDLDIVRLALVVCVVVIALAWVTPALADAFPAAKNSWDRVVTPWWNDLRNVFDNAFASLKSTIGIVSDYYGPSLALGRGSRLSDTVVFMVQVPQNPPPGVRYYWRARVYENYDNGWSSSLQTTRPLDAQDIPLVFPDMADNAPGQYPFTFILQTSLATFLAPSQVIWLSRPATAELAYNPDGSVDLGSLRASPPLHAGEAYSVRSSFNSVTVAALRRAGTEYPDWVRERYLQLPSNITPRTLELAAILARGKETPYDIAQAITDYLRTNYQYSETLPPLPSDQELIDWFLFDLKQGFCNYYATAEVILLRAAGIPARLAVGYAQGEPEEATPFYVVRQRDAHAWPEVYFPGIGWVEFEPTASQPQLVRPLGDESNQSDAGINPNLPESEEATPPVPREINPALEEVTLPAERLAFRIGIGLTLVLIVLLLPVFKRQQWHKKLPLLPIALEKGFVRLGFKPPRFLRNWAHLARLSPIERAYHEINLALKRLGTQPTLTDTPAERTAKLVMALPGALASAHALLAEYHRYLYSPQKNANLNVALRASAEIRWLSYKAYFRRLLIPQKAKDAYQRVSQHA